MLSFPVVFVSSARESDRNRINVAKRSGDFSIMTFLDGKGVCLILIGKKNRISRFFIEFPDFFFFFFFFFFFSWVSRFSFITGWQV